MAKPSHRSHSHGMLEVPHPNWSYDRGHEVAITEECLLGHFSMNTTGFGTVHNGLKTGTQLGIENGDAA